MQSMKHRLYAIALATSLALGACTASLPSPETLAMTETATETAHADTTTYCLGRFLIDVPAGSKLSGGSYKYDFARIEKPQAMSLEQFNQELKEREEKLRSIKHKIEPSLLRTTRQPAPNSRILAFFEEPYIDSIAEIEGYKWVNGIRFLIKDEVDDDKQDLGLKAMTSILSRLRPRADADIPADPGYCFEGGFIANAEWENEEAGIDFRISGHPDAILSIDVYPLASYKRDKPLLERMGGALQQLGAFAGGVHVLREGDRQIGTYQGQEYLATGPNSGGMRGHLFTWETQGEGTLDTPAIEITLETGRQDSKGNPQQTSLSNEQALQLWDSIIRTFRLRPVGGTPAQTSETPQPKAPLGELAATGRSCPQTGWWHCVETGEVAGGQRQHFQAGERMPHAVLPGKASAWQKLKGERPIHQVATVWKLVDYDAAPVAPTPAVEPAPSSPDTSVAAAPDAARNTEPPSKG